MAMRSASILESGSSCASDISRAVQCVTSSRSSSRPTRSRLRPCHACSGVLKPRLRLGQAPFNESFAMFVGARGSAAFFRSRGQEEAARKVEERWQDDKLLARFWGSIIRSLDSAYAANPASKAARLAARDTVYQRARITLVREIGPALRTINPRYAERVPLDNAALLARRVYASDLDLFDRIYEREGKDLKRAIGRVIGVARKNKDDPFAGLRAWLGGAVAPEAGAE